MTRKSDDDEQDRKNGLQAHGVGLLGAAIVRLAVPIARRDPPGIGLTASGTGRRLGNRTGIPALPPTSATMPAFRVGPRRRQLAPLAWVMVLFAVEVAKADGLARFLEQH